MKSFSDVPMFLQTMSFHCGGNFAFETYESGDISDGIPNRLESSELNDKLMMERTKSAEDWSITPDTIIKPTKIDFMEMLKEQARSSNDKALLDAVNFLTRYKESHSHFIILGAKFTLSNLLKEMNTKPRIPSTTLNPTENVVLSCLTLHDFPQLDIHEGSQPMFCLCVQIMRRDEEIFKDIRSYLDCIQNVPLNRICLLLYGADDQNKSVTFELKRQVQDMFGISKSLTFGSGNLSDLATGLLKVQAEKEETVEYRSYSDYKTGKVIITPTKMHIKIFCSIYLFLDLCFQNPC